MSFNLITEGSKDYIKYVLQLSEAKKSSRTKGKKTPPTDPKPVINVPTEDKKRPTRAAGSGGRPFKTTSTPKWDDDFLDSKPYDTEKNDSLLTPILFGGSNIPNARGNFPNKSAIGKDGPEDTDESGGLDYLTNVAQGASIVDYADQMLPAAAKLALSASLFGKKVKKTPDNDDGTNPSTGMPSSGNKALDSFNIDLMSKVKEYAGGKNLGPLGDKVFKYSQNLGALDPLNPLLGLKLGYEMLGGNEILKRTRELGAAQSSGAQSSMGHPSGFGYYGR
jgi:hypothetical protein